MTRNGHNSREGRRAAKAEGDKRPRVVLPSKKQVKRDLEVLEFVSEAVEHMETVTKETLDCVVEV